MFHREIFSKVTNLTIKWIRIKRFMNVIIKGWEREWYNVPPHKLSLTLEQYSKLEIRTLIFPTGQLLW